MNETTNLPINTIAPHDKLTVETTNSGLNSFQSNYELVILSGLKPGDRLRVRNGSIEKISLLVRFFEYFAGKLSYFGGTDASNNELIKEHFFKVINSYEPSVYQKFIEDIGSTIGSAKDIPELEKAIENIDRLDEITKEPINPQLAMLKEKISLLRKLIALKVDYDNLLKRIKNIEGIKKHTDPSRTNSGFSEIENLLSEKTTALDEKLIDIKKLEKGIQALLKVKMVGHDGSESLSIESLIRANISKSLTEIHAIITAANYTVCQDGADEDYQHRVIYTNHQDTISKIIEWSRVNLNTSEEDEYFRKLAKVQNLLRQLNPIEEPSRPNLKVEKTTDEGVSSRGPVTLEWQFYSVDEGDS